MFLNPATLPHYLVSRGLISPEELVSGSFQIHENGRRNRNYIVQRGEHVGLFVKQVPLVMGETVNSVFREAACYRMAGTKQQFAELKALVPCLVDYNQRQHCLVTELLPQGETYTQAHNRLKSFPVELAVLAGEALGRIRHASPQMIVETEDTTAFPRIAPWVLTIPSKAETIFPALGGALAQVVGSVRSSPILVSGLEGLNTAWRKIALINGDIKWENFLLLSSPTKRLYIMDWELADVGDPAWDIAGAIAAYVQYWVTTLSADNSTLELNALVQSAPYHPDSIKPAIKQLWSSYVHALGWSEQQANQELPLVFAFIAARLVLTSCEHAIPLQQMSRSLVLYLQLANALFANPAQSAFDLLGLQAK